MSVIAKLTEALPYIRAAREDAELFSYSESDIRKLRTLEKAANRLMAEFNERRRETERRKGAAA
jgi:hypothetical protein